MCVRLLNLGGAAIVPSNVLLTNDLDSTVHRPLTHAFFWDSTDINNNHQLFDLLTRSNVNCYFARFVSESIISVNIYIIGHIYNIVQSIASP